MRRFHPGSVGLIDKQWYWRTRLANGRQHATLLAATTREEAEQEAARLYGYIPTSRRGTYADQLRAIIRLGEWAAAELKRVEPHAGGVETPLATVWRIYDEKSTAGKATRDMYARTWRHFASWAAEQGIKCVEGVGAQEAALWAASGPPARAAKYLATVWRGAGLDAAIFADLEKQQEKKPPEQYRRLAPAEAQAVLDALRASSSLWAAMAADMVVVGWYTGLRVSDVGRLTASQYDAEAKVLRVVPKKTAKRKPHPLTIPLVGPCAKIVAKRAKAGGDLFPGVISGRQVRREVYDELSPAFGRLEQSAGWLTSFHSLRASFISMMDEAGVPAAVTDAITGHAPQTMHGHYSQPGVAALREAVERAVTPLR